MIDELNEAIAKRQKEVDAWVAEQIAYDKQNHIDEPNPAQDIKAYLEAVAAEPVVAPTDTDEAALRKAGKNVAKPAKAAPAE